jgi:hypothetical protein
MSLAHNKISPINIHLIINFKIQIISVNFLLITIVISIENTDMLPFMVIINFYYSLWCIIYVLNITLISYLKCFQKQPDHTHYKALGRA